jgi:hypothetical protein
MTERVRGITPAPRDIWLPGCCFEAWLSHKSTTTAVRCRFVQRPGCPPAVIRGAAEGGVATRVGDLSNALDLCDSHRRNQQSRIAAGESVPAAPGEVANITKPVGVRRAA